MALCLISLSQVFSFREMLNEIISIWSGTNIKINIQLVFLAFPLNARQKNSHRSHNPVLM